MSQYSVNPYNKKMKVDLVVPVFNGAEVLENSIDKTVEFIKSLKEHEINIIIADNASSDTTGDIGRRLSEIYSNVKYLKINRKGRGYALRTAWESSNADIVSYMDVDLSTDLTHIKDIINKFTSNEYDLVYGSRLMKRSIVKRSLFREILSRSYNLIVRNALNVSSIDLQCGFKAISKKACDDLLPFVQDNEWFFDTELMYYAEKKGYRMIGIPVVWIEDKESTVEILKTIIDYIFKVISLAIRKK